MTIIIDIDDHLQTRLIWRTFWRLCRQRRSPIWLTRWQQILMTNICQPARGWSKYLCKMVFILNTFYRTAYRCEKEATGELNRDSLINYVNEIALNTPDAEEKVKFEAGVKRGKVYVPKYSDEEHAEMEKTESSQVRLDPEEEQALSNATLNDIMALADILNTNPQDFVMEAYADPLQYFEPDPPNTTNPKEMLEKIQNNDKETKDVCLNNIAGISEQLFCDIFNAIKNNDQVTKFSACNCDVSDY